MLSHHRRLMSVSLSSSALVDQASCALFATFWRGGSIDRGPQYLFVMSHMVAN